MGRLSIEVTDAQHQQIKARAALSGMTLKDYILRQTLAPAGEEAEAMRELEALLAPRIAQAERGEYSKRSMKEIREEARRRFKSQS